MRVVRLIYVSRSKIGGDLMKIRNLRVECKTLNECNGVSGALYLDNTTFFQVLEGQEDRISALFETIRVDPRHHDVAELERRFVDEPLFGRWSMKLVYGELRPRIAVGYSYDDLASVKNSLLDKHIAQLLES